MMFSIIIPTYNRAGIIQSAINSVLTQNFSDFEVIVVDDGSTDGTRQKVEALKNEKIKYYFKTNEERSVARNFGADRAKGRYLIFLDSDDRLREDHLFNVHRYLSEKQFTPKFLFTGYAVVTPDGSMLFEYKASGIARKKKLLYGNYLGCSSAVVERELFYRHRFNEHTDIILFEDWELWLRITSDTDLHCIPAGSVIMINHAQRSVLNCSPGLLIRKIDYFKAEAFSHIPLVNQSWHGKRTFTMGLYSYVSLHVAMTGKNRAIAIAYLFRAMVRDPLIIAKRRFYAIIKHLLS